MALESVSLLVEASEEQVGLTTRQLVERARQGDRQAFGDLVERYRDMVYGLGYHLTTDFESARDLAQEAFVQAYLKLGQLRGPDRFPGWLRQIITNVHHNLTRRREVTSVALEEASDVPDRRQPSEIEVVVREALSKLREPERLALTLHYINGYSHAEIGGFLGVRPEAVKTRLARARQHLKAEVMAMVEDTFEKKKLPTEFTEETVEEALKRALVARDTAEFGIASWRDAEHAHLEVLKRTPQDPIARTYLGRMYTRWGRFQEALQVLPTDSSALGGWAGLNRAFCLDALGRRSEAVALYQEIAETDNDSIRAWARLGLERPTWPKDLDMGAEAGEVCLTPTAEWRASASSSRSPGRPEFAVDGNRETRWAAAGRKHGQEPGIWLRLDFDTPQLVSRIAIDHLGLGNYVIGAWARGLKVTATNDGVRWYEAECSRGGPQQPGIAQFRPVQPVRAVQFSITANHDPEWWSVYEVCLFGPA